VLSAMAAGRAWDLVRSPLCRYRESLQIDNIEDDAFHMLGSAIVDAVADDAEHSASLFEVWTELEEQPKLS
jgi:hypothetical protein